jgi:hypothetical protein
MLASDNLLSLGNFVFSAAPFVHFIGVDGALANSDVFFCQWLTLLLWLWLLLSPARCDHFVR